MVTSLAAIAIFDSKNIKKNKIQDYYSSYIYPVTITSTFSASQQNKMTHFNICGGKKIVLCIVLLSITTLNCPKK